jgi:hypothetical protein
MKIITHKFRRNNDDIVYLVNLVDVTGHPLSSVVAETKEKRNEISSSLAIEHNIKNVLHNPGFSILA